ncbi:MAG TPA: hypothetical protein VLB46_20180 [Pyrinomonadaceae bacterium]|nr:hypothetical protein [Pyrinomonadaceae bacterium]
MNYKFKLQGLRTPDGTISIRTLQLLVNSLTETCERGLRLAVQGESVKRGPIPGWLARSLDFTITRIKKGSTTILLDAPPLGETAPDQIKQQDLWFTKPTPEDTAITLVSRSVKEVLSQNFESYAYDEGVLDGLLSFETFFKTYAAKLTVEATGRPAENFSLSSVVLEKVQEIKAEIPEPIATVISGKFDLIQYTGPRFHLVLGDGHTILGTIDRDILSVEDMRKFWGKKVTIKGSVHFHPGRKIKLLEAQSIKLAEEGEEVFDRLPSPGKPLTLFDLEVQKLNANPALKEIWGKWPGDESIEELLSALTP